jgi:hypothetical protein
MRMTLEFLSCSPEGVVAMEMTMPVLGRSRGRYDIATPIVSKIKSTDPLGITDFGSDLV